MKYSKKLIAIASITGAVGIGGIGATALAATSSGTTSYPPIVQKLASTFGLDPAKVNDVFKQQKQDNMANRQAKLKSTLDQAVKDGKLTQDQEDKLIAELQSLRSQAKDNRQDIRTQLQQWAKDNGVTNLDQILPAPGAGIHHTMDKDGDAGDSAASN
jgi:polyhydroxyalkanoate synthesis regulator phasin